MTESEIHGRLRQQFVDGVVDWDEGATKVRIERLTHKLKALFPKVGLEGPHDELGYYWFDMPLAGAPNRFRLRTGAVTKAGGRLCYLSLYCCVPMPLVEGRWHVVTLDSDRTNSVHASYDLLDGAWLSDNPGEADLALKVAELAEECGWQVVGPEITEKPAPKDWPRPLAGLDYGSGEYLIRDYIIRGLRDY